MKKQGLNIEQRPCESVITRFYNIIRLAEIERMGQKAPTPEYQSVDHAGVKISTASRMQRFGATDGKHVPRMLPHLIHCDTEIEVIFSAQK